VCVYGEGEAPLTPEQVFQPKSGAESKLKEGKFVENKQRGELSECSGGG
jgi:hypothetical protein